MSDHAIQPPSAKTAAGGLVAMLYGVATYLLFLVTFLYAIAFVGNLPVPKTIDSGQPGPLIPSLIINALLLGLFAVQHSVMARPAFKRVWTRVIPESAERSTYTLLSSVALILLFWLWSPLGGTVWDVQDATARAVLYAIYAFGWALLLYTTFLLNHFELFGLRQVWLQFRGRAYTHLPFRTPTVYRWVRHPLYVAWLLTFWATPTMTVTHLLFAVMTTAYILIAIRWEERDLIALFGDQYRRYREQVSMLIPLPGRKSRG